MAGARAIVALVLAGVIIAAGLQLAPGIASDLEDWILGPDADDDFGDDQGGNVSYRTLAAAYIVTSAGSIYKSTNAVSGQVLTSGSNAATVIQTTLNALTPERVHKEAVLLKGSFVLSAPVELPSYTVLTLDGKVTVTTYSGPMLYAEDARDFEVVGGEWDRSGGSRTYTDGNSALYFEDCRNGLIADLYVHNGPNNNLYVYDCSYMTIRNVESRNAAYMLMEMSYSNHCVIEDCELYDGQCGIYFFAAGTEDEASPAVQDVGHNVVRRTHVEGTQQSGISISLRGVEDVGDYNLFELNTVVDCGQDGDHPGINLGFGTGKESEHSIVRNNVITSPEGLSGAGIIVSGVDCQVYGNSITGAGEQGILIGGTSNSVTSNTITGCGSQHYPAISVYGNNNVVTGNTLSDNYADVVTVHSGTGNTITPNTVV
jgi:hypothetical protein